MKRNYYIFIALIFINFTAAFAQNSEGKQVTTGAGYADEVYYSLANGDVKTVARNTWDIAFTTTKFDVTVLINDGFDTRLYEYPGADIGDWEDITDTTGLSSWDQLHNSEETWFWGAFNANSSGDFDYGWGEYNITTHNVEGNNIYIIILPDGTIKKIAIVQKNSIQNEWYFIYSDLDGGNFVEVSFDADDYTSYNFIHYSIVNQQFVEQEAASSDWDLLFTKYYDNSIPYYVTGVLANYYIPVQQVDMAGMDQANFFNYDTSQFSEVMNTIGSDWKSFDLNSFSYLVSDSTVFFIMDINEDIYKIYFTAFSGSSTGVYTFNQEKVFTSSVSENVAYAGVYPNPAVDQLNVIYNIDGDCDYTIYNITGRKVKSGELSENNKLNKALIDVADIRSGIYSVVITNGKETAIAKFVKN